MRYVCAEPRPRPIRCFYVSTRRFFYVCVGEETRRLSETATETDASGPLESDLKGIITAGCDFRKLVIPFEDLKGFTTSRTACLRKRRERTAEPRVKKHDGLRESLLG